MLVALACYSAQDLKRAEDKGACRVYCIKVQKMEDGKLFKGKCACLSLHEISRLTEKTFTLVGDDSEVTGNFKVLPVTPSIVPPEDFGWPFKDLKGDIE